LKNINLIIQIFTIFFLINVNNTHAKIGVINLRLLMEQAPQSIIAKQIIENDFKVRKQRLVTLQKKIDSRTSKLINEKNTIPEDKKEKSSLTLENMKTGMNALEKEYQTDYIIRQKEAAENFFQIVKEEIKNLAKEKKYIIVIQSESVFWAHNNLDITEQVLSLLNQNSYLPCC